MIRDMLNKSHQAAVAVSGGMDSLVVLDRVRKHDPDIDVVVCKTDFTSHQWAIIDNLIRLWNLTVVAPLPQASYLVPNNDQLARVDEYNLGGATVPILRDIVHSDRCLFDLEKKFSVLSPLTYDCLFVGTRSMDHTGAGGYPLTQPITQVGEMWIVAPIFHWTDEQVRKAAQDLPYAKEWYEGKDEAYDTGNLMACSRCVRTGTSHPVPCPKSGRVIQGHEWDQLVMLQTFREKFGFIGENYA